MKNLDMVLTTVMDLVKTCKDQGVILKGNGDGSVRLEIDMNQYGTG